MHPIVTLLLRSIPFLVIDMVSYLNLQNMIKKVFGHRYISNICGNPFAIDTLMTALVGPYPELNDFNGVSMGLPLDKPLVLVGKVPRHARYWSFQLFLDNVEENSTEQTMLDDHVRIANRETGEFVVVVSRKEAKPHWCYGASEDPSKQEGAANWIEAPAASKKCILVMRMYCPLHGERLVFPKVYSMPFSAIEGETMDNMLSSKDRFELPHAFSARDFSLYGKPFPSHPHFLFSLSLLQPRASPPRLAGPGWCRPSS